MSGKSFDLNSVDFAIVSGFELRVEKEEPGFSSWFPVAGKVIIPLDH